MCGRCMGPGQKGPELDVTSALRGTAAKSPCASLHQCTEKAKCSEVGCITKDPRDRKPWKPLWLGTEHISSFSTSSSNSPTGFGIRMLPEYVTRRCLLQKRVTKKPSNVRPAPQTKLSQQGSFQSVKTVLQQTHVHNAGGTRRMET